VSGINNGANLGDDTIYSGTVGAAMEGFLFGIPAIAFSQVDKGWAHLDAAAAKAKELVVQLLQGSPGLIPGLVTETPWLLNVNVPNVPLDQLLPAKVCRLGRRHAAEPVVTQLSPRGDTLYWIGAAGPAKEFGEGTDFASAAAGHVAVTPLKVDLTDHSALQAWGQRLLKGAVA
jgi:5'-nucleotidase